MLLDLKDFENYFNKNDLKIIDIYGNYKLSSFDVNKSPRLILISKKTQHKAGLNIGWAATYSPTKLVVPSALLVLTSLFEMVRGEHQCCNHPNFSHNLIVRDNYIQ